MNMEHYWNDSDGKTEGLGICVLLPLYHKLHMDWPGIKPGPPC